MNDDNMDESQKYPAKQKKPYQNNNKTTKQAKNPFIKKKTLCIILFIDMRQRNINLLFHLFMHLLVDFVPGLSSV